MKKILLNKYTTIYSQKMKKVSKLNKHITSTSNAIFSPAVKILLMTYVSFAKFII